MEILSIIFVVCVLDGIGRKPLLSFCQILAGVSCILAAFTDEHMKLGTALSLMGRGKSKTV